MTPNEATIILEWWAKEKAKRSVVGARTREEALAKGLATSQQEIRVAVARLPSC